MKQTYKIIANWKAFGTTKDVDQFLKNVSIPNNSKLEIIFSVPFVFLHLFKTFIEQERHQNCSLAVQNISYDLALESSTGEINFNNLRYFDIQYCILGHSERRRFENSDLIFNKIAYSIKSGVIPIICIDDKEESQNYQIANIAKILQEYKDIDLLIAYEPISSIGTGVAQPNEEIDRMILKLKNIFNHNNIQFLYGGSVNEENINIMIQNKNINGLLVGKKSWNYSSFNKITSKVNEWFI